MIIMAVSDKQYNDMCRMYEQRAVELLATVSAAKTNAVITFVSVMIALASLVTAIISIRVCH